MMRLLLTVLALLLPVPALADLASDAQIVFLGEVHDNPDHHLTQAEWIRALSPKAVVFEMITPETATGSVYDMQTGAEALQQALDWNASGWPDFAIYWPVFQALGPAQVYGAAVPRAKTRAVFTDGAGAVFSPQTVSRFGLDAALPPAQQDAREAMQFAAHCDAMPMEMMPGMVTVQRVRDAQLARVALLALSETGGPVVVITGNGHARKDWGAPAAIARAAPDVRVFALGQSEDGRAPDGAFDQIADAPAAQRPDPCAGFK